MNCPKRSTNSSDASFSGMVTIEYRFITLVGVRLLLKFDEELNSSHKVSLVGPLSIKSSNNSI